MKDGGTLWVKASGKWLAHALEEEIFLPVPRASVVRSMEEGREYVEEYTTPTGAQLRPSVETSMHAVIPQRVVIHVHSVRTISWAVRADMPEAVRDRMAGLRWAWLPYVHPGMILGDEIRQHLNAKPDVFILGNHGLIVAAEDCDSAERLLNDVERRLDCPVRGAPPADAGALLDMLPDDFRIAPDPEVHALATDLEALKTARLGTLYPDECVYLGPAFAVVDECHPIELTIQNFTRLYGVKPKVVLVAGKGVAVADELNRAGREVLISVKRVVERVSPGTPVRALGPVEVSSLLNWDAEKYRIALASEYEE